jgi:predicted metal-binding protein
MKIILEKEIEAQRIVVSPRPVWKCRACPKYGKTPSCPPHVPSWKETRDWIKCFQTAIIVKFEIDMRNFEEEKREASIYLLKREKEFFSEGRPFAFSLFPGNCNLCAASELKR